MSSSVVSPAQWSGQLPGTLSVDSGSSARLKKTVPPPRKSKNGKKEVQPKSTSPAPTTSTRSTRSRKTVTYSESDSPELNGDKTLPPILKQTKTPLNPPYKGKSVKMSKSVSASSFDSQRTLTPTPSALDVVYSESEEIVVEPPRSKKIPAPKTDLVIKSAITPEPVKAELPPSASTLKISFRNGGAIKRPAVSQDPTADEDGSTTYDDTPRLSPNLDAGVDASKATESIPQTEEAKIEGPKRAPRKKRKWLKRGEVDPDDPVAVARQQERFGLLDRATELVEQEMEAVRNGTHPHLAILFNELDARKDRLMEQSNAKHEIKKQVLTTAKMQAQSQARTDHHVERDRILDDLLAEQRRAKHRIVSEKLSSLHPADAYPILAFGRGGRGYPLHTTNLVSNHRQKLVSYEVDGQIRQRKDITMNLELVPSHVAKADLEAMTRNQKPSDTAKRSKPATTKAEAARPSVAGSSGTTATTTAQRPPSQWPKTGAYEVADLPPYKAGAVPMRQTPTHSPTPTPARRPSPPPPAATSALSTGVHRHSAGFRPPGQVPPVSATTSTLVSGSNSARPATVTVNSNPPLIRGPQFGLGGFAPTRRS